MSKFVIAIHQLHYGETEGDKVVQKVIQPRQIFDAAVVESAGFPAGAYRDATDAEVALYEKTEGLNKPAKAPTAADKKAAAQAEAEAAAAPEKKAAGDPPVVQTPPVDGDVIA